MNLRFITLERSLRFQAKIWENKPRLPAVQKQSTIPTSNSINNTSESTIDPTQATIHLKFSTIITSLKALDESFSSRNHVRKFLRTLPTKWRLKVMEIEESKDLSTLPLDELIGNLKVYEVVLETDSEISKGKKEKHKSLALKARKFPSDEEVSCSESDDEEYAMAVRDFKKIFRRRGKFVCQPHDEKKNFRKIKEDKRRKKIVACDHGKRVEQLERNKEAWLKCESCDNLQSKVSSLSLKLASFESSSYFLQEMIDNQRSLKDKHGLGFTVDIASTRKTITEKLGPVDVETSTVEPVVPVPSTREPTSSNERNRPSSKESEILETNVLKRNSFLQTRKPSSNTPVRNVKQTPILKLSQELGKGTITHNSLTIHDVSHVENLSFNLLSIGQICDKKCKVLFSDTGSEILKDDITIGRGIRNNGLYIMKMGNLPKDSLCLTLIDDTSTLWHRRLGHTNMQLIQSLSSKELVRNLPKLKFKSHFCDACNIGKQVHASHKAKNMVSTTKCLELLHMDLFGRSAIQIYGGNFYTLDYLTKFEPKSTEGVFLGYSPNSKAYIILNKDTMRIKESLNVTFDESPPPKLSPLADDDIIESQIIENQIEDIEIKENESLNKEIVNIKESKDHPIDSVIEPKNVKEAIQDESWTMVMQEELNQFKTNDVWSFVPPTDNQTIIATKWVFKNKLDENGVVSRNKARLVTQWYHQQEGIYFDETYAPVARLESIRILLSYACASDFKLFQMDVKSTFLNGFINEEVYVAQPPSFVDFEKPNHVFKLKKALYGLKQELKAWYNRLKAFLIDHMYTIGLVDNTLFTKKKYSHIIIVQIYVDDIIFGSTCQDLCDDFSKIMYDEFEIIMMDKLNFFLGLQIKQLEDGIFFKQSKYIKEMLMKFGLEDSKPIKIPMSSKTKLTRDEDRKSVDDTKYRGMIGSLLYLTASRQNIMFSVCLCARFQEVPKTSHLEAVKRMFRYIKGITHLGLWYPKGTGVETIVYIVFDHTGDYVDRKSTSGMCTFIGCCLTSWFSKKHTALAISTTEAEYISARKACQQALWMKQALVDYNIKLDDIPILCDHNGNIDLSKNLVLHSRTKHRNMTSLPS
ncbi:retrovirus-related pol polyprotein from transposon TNT 1-94 [Tanacetum coccineum]